MRKNILLTFSIIFISFLNYSQLYVYFPETGIGQLCKVKLYIDNEYIGSVKYNSYQVFEPKKVGVVTLEAKSGCGWTNRKITVDLSEKTHYIEAGLNNIDLYLVERDYSEVPNSFKSVFPTPKYQNPIVEDEIKISTGTGFLINKTGVIATNHHVINGAKTITVLLDGKEYLASILSSDKTNDIALIQLHGFDALESIPYSISTDYEIGDDVFTIGYPNTSVMGKNYKMTNGVINSLSGIQDDVTFMQISVPIQPGNSGGPLFNKKGQIVGITTSTLNPFFIAYYSRSIPQNVNYAVKSDYLNIIAKKYVEKSDKNLEHMSLSEKTKLLNKYVAYIEVVIQ
jgi:S1-C subfamily serine protease